MSETLPNDVAQEAYRSEEDIDATFDELSLACGEDVLGRVTELQIIGDDFVGDPTLLNLSAAKIRAINRREVTIIRPATVLGDIVVAVMRRTHPDVINNAKGRSAFTLLCEDFTGLDTEDKSIKRELTDNFERVLSDERGLPDLMRGMSAFSDAEMDHWSGVYEASIIRPATVMAAWMIAHERNEPLE